MRSLNLNRWLSTVDELSYAGFDNATWKLKELDENGVVYYPQKTDILRSLLEVGIEDVKVVILGQDPYYTDGTADGLAFSTRQDTIPPSLRNILREVRDDVNGSNCERPQDLVRWSKQGVLLLNTFLTVEQSLPVSHRNIGWKEFTDGILRVIDTHCPNTVFMLWGNLARQKANMLDYTQHLILEAAHPSPLSASRGFFGCKHFSQANAYLQEHGKEPIEW